MNRSIEHARSIPGGVAILCDCGTLTELRIDTASGAPDLEAAFTCDGCLTVRWFTVITLAGGETP